MRTRAQLALLHALAALAQRLPRARAEPWCRLAGRAWYLAAPAARRAVRANLRHVLAREPSPQQVRAVFEHGALSYWDTFALPRFSRAEVLELVQLTGWDHLDTALAAGKGAILAGAHLGSVALAAQLISARGYPQTAAVERIDPPEVLAFFLAHRQAFGTRLVPAGPAAVRALLGALRRNEVVSLVTDRDVTQGGLTVTFFDAPTSFSDAAAALALRTGAPILPAVAVRDRSGRLRGGIEPPLPVPRTGSAGRDVRQLTQALALRLEYHIRNAPFQWTVFQERWPGAAPRGPRAGGQAE